MIHHHAAGLHKGVADGWPNKVEAGFFQGFAHGLGLRRDGWNLGALAEMVDHRLTINKGPQVFDRVIKLEPGQGILPNRLEFEAIAHNARVLHQLFDFIIAQLGQALDIEAMQHLAIAFALLEHGDPRQTGLKTFKQQQLEEFIGVS